MTLRTVPRYDRDQIAPVGEHAVVVGASVAGLLTGRVLADAFDEVTIIDRDPLPDEPDTRRGVPQGEHVHVLQEAGRATFEDLFPGYGETLLAAGGLVIDTMSDFVHYEKGGYFTDGEVRIPMYCATRPLLEQVVRRYIADFGGVTIRQGCQQTGYLATGDPPAVTGVEVRADSGGPEELTADLVVDATGRVSQTPMWLEDHGYGTPPVDEVHIDIAYSTVTVQRPTDDRRAFFVPPDPPRTRGAGVFPVEDDQWIATLVGVHGDHPPTDPDAIVEFAASLPVPEIRQVVDGQEWTGGDVAYYPFPSNRRRRYESLDRFPDGLLVVGDALASFNPIYGQGMSVAALEALVLHDTLATADSTNLARRFFDDVESIVDVPWSIAVGGDFEFPATTGPKPRGIDLLNRYIARVMRTAQTDWRVREALVRVFMLEKRPSSLFHPDVAWRVLTPTWSTVVPLSDSHTTANREQGG
ncbi:NAD(P)/FAD-dependent oxidoreductase [Haloarcula sp. JP-L23]|uniref:FAD-dependent oxidoreductase n=1 Tax=Haloarcula sp. JP-L23 TaxID=2716717 RepID=UPI00140E996D|nr:FAD-dependent monooxygenase [Haloarcula sp. JP-L23]